MELFDVYTDGSYNSTTKQASWAFIVIKENNIIHKNKGIITDFKINEMFQVGGEIKAILEALEWAKEKQVKINVLYDFANLKRWVADIWNEKSWKTNKIYTIEYRKRVFELKDHLNNMVKVKAHSGEDKWNDFVDSYAKT